MDDGISRVKAGPPTGSPPTQTELPSTADQSNGKRPQWNMKDGKLHRTEEFWKTHQPWLAELGYSVRPRYRRDWQASWIGTSKDPFDCEDAQILNRVALLDARQPDGRDVIIKKFRPSVHPHEAAIGQYLSSSECSQDPRNHSVPVYDVLSSPHEQDTSLLVMPLLRPFDNPPFDTFGEVVDFFSQVFEGMQFLHQHHVAHRDGNGNNIMMDPTSLYPDMYHPVDLDRSRDYKSRAFHYTRTQKPPKYYIIDFGISRRYSLDQLPVDEEIIMGGDKSPPEHQGDAERADPFPTDVYFLGSMIKKNFINPTKGFEFVEPLIRDMTQTDPTKRPTMDQVVARFAEIRDKLDLWKLRSRLAPRGEFFIAGLWRAVPHWRRRIGYIWNDTPAIPRFIS